MIMMIYRERVSNGFIGNKEAQLCLIPTLALERSRLELVGELPTHVPPPKSVLSQRKDKDIHELRCGVLREASAREAAAGNLPKMICPSS